MSMVDYAKNMATNHALPLGAGGTAERVELQRFDAERYLG